MRHALLLLLLAALPACDTLQSDGDGRSLRLTNAADRPVAVFAVSGDELPLIDPQPAMRAVDFDARSVEPGRTVQLDAGLGYDAGDDVVVFVYARGDSLPGHLLAHYGAGAAPLVKVQKVTAAELRMRGYTVVVHDLRP